MKTCKRNHLVEGDNAFWRKDKRHSKGGWWACRKCRAIEEAVERMKKEKPLRLATRGRYCNEGHLIEGDNKVWTADPRRKAGGYWQCAHCRRRATRKAQAQYVARKEKMTVAKMVTAAAEMIFAGGNQDEVLAEAIPTIVSARLKRVSPPPDARTVFSLGDKTRLEVMAELEKMMAAEKKNPLAHLNVKPDAERAWDRFNKALEEARTSGVNVPNCQDKPAPYADYDEENIPSAEDAYGLCFGCPLIELCSSYAEQERPAWGVWAGEAWAYGEIVNNE